MDKSNSEKLYNEARKLIPGGVNSPVRACRSVDTHPLFIEKANGCMIYDVDGNEFIDYVCAWGCMILGHRPKSVISAIKKVLNYGIGYGAPTKFENELASLIIDSVPSIESVRMVNSGTEAAMSAIRLARGYTKRNKVIKFDGCYHGHVDSLLVGAGSGVATLNIPGSLGIPNSFINDTISLPFNNIELVNNVMKEHGDEVACIIVEPVAGNMGVIPANYEFLKFLRDITFKTGSILIFDEVITGFRLALGGAQEFFKLTPDLTCLGKIIGGGIPIGAYGGRSDIMVKVSPDGEVYQAGTLSGNPIAMVAGIATLNELKKENFYKNLNLNSDKFFTEIKKVTDQSKIPIFMSKVGSMLSMYFNSTSVIDYESSKASDLYMFSKYYNEMLDLGIYLAPSQFETLFISSSHDLISINKTVEAIKTALDKLN